MDDASQNDTGLNSLEDPGTTLQEAPLAQAPVDGSSQPSVDGGPLSNAPKPAKPHRSLITRLRQFMAGINVYFLVFILLIIISIAVVALSLRYTRKQNQTTPIIAQTLSQNALDQLKSTDANVGDSKQILNIKSNTIFGGTVLVRSNLDIAGQLKVSGALTLPGITVAGTSTLDQLQANGLTVSGNATIQKGLNVTGNGTFGGTLSASSLSINTLQLSGDLQLNRHVDAGGSAPSKSDGSALGGGGTSSVSGTDTAGSVTLNTGGSPPAGCFITVTFAQKFNAIPHVTITPVGSAAAGLNYYINRSAANFSICSTNAAPATSSLSFDYIVID